MKRTHTRLLALLFLLLLACALAGCEARPKPGQAEDEILTYRRLDPDKTTITVSRTGNASIAELIAGFEAANPDVQVVYQDITGGDQTARPILEWVERGRVPDVMFAPQGTFPAEMNERYFTDLSAHPLVARYNAEALSEAAVDSRIYCLPGPSNVYGLIYNKTLFDQYGWALPRTFDEFIALCKQIRADTNGTVDPWNPNAKYDNELVAVLEGMLYQELFAGLNNRAWLEDFRNGKASFSPHMAPLYEAIEKLCEAGILREEHFTYSATARGKEFGEGKIAMINYPATIFDNELYEYGFLPLPTSGEGVGYLHRDVIALLRVPKKERDEKTQEAVERFLAYFSSEEGQRAYVGKELMISNVQGVTLEAAERLASLQPAIEAGHLFSRVNFHGPLGRANFSLREQCLQMVTGEKTAAECLSAVDEAPFVPESQTDPALATVLATVQEDFTVLQTSFLMADMYRQSAGAQIGLIANNVAYRGNLMCLFQGDLTVAHARIILPRSFANDATLVKLAMTGRQILDALNAPPDYNGKTANALYAFSGLKCTLAPWQPLGQKYREVALSDGTPLDPQATYTVAAWAGTIGDEYITETLETFEGTFEEHLTAYLRAAGTIAPVRDGRYKLVWD